MHNNLWQPPHQGHFQQQPFADPQVQYCRDCGQYHPIPQQNIARQEFQPNFQGPPVPEQPLNFQQPEFRQMTNHTPQPQTQQLIEQQPIADWGRRITLVEAINMALEQVPGEPVEAELKHKHGMQIYEVDIVNEQGIKYEVEVDVNTGRIMSVEQD